MDTKCIYLDCPAYKFDDSINLKDISKIIDNSLIENFHGRNVVLRGIQSEKHNIPKQEIVNHILKAGSDKYELKSINEVKACDNQIDLFGYTCNTISPPITLNTLEGFHR